MMNQPTPKQIEITAREAKNAAAGIVIDGVKLPIPIKVCKGCAVQYPATNDYFYRNNQIKDGWSGKCKKCTKRMIRNRPGPGAYKLTDAEKEERARKQRVKRQAIRKEAQKWAERKAKNKKAQDKEEKEREKKKRMIAYIVKNEKAYNEVGMLLTELPLTPKTRKGIRKKRMMK